MSRNAVYTQRVRRMPYILRDIVGEIIINVHDRFLKLARVRRALWEVVGDWRRKLIVSSLYSYSYIICNCGHIKRRVPQIRFLATFFLTMFTESSVHQYHTTSNSAKSLYVSPMVRKN